MSTLPPKGLVVREPWISKLLDGSKVWELRGSTTAHRGRTGLIASGSGSVVGEASLQACIGPLDLQTLAETASLHAVPIDWLRENLRYRNTYAWVFADPLRYGESVPYAHPQ